MTDILVPEDVMKPAAWQHRLIFAGGQTEWRDGRQNWSEEELQKIDVTYEERPLYTAPSQPRNGSRMRNG